MRFHLRHASASSSFKLCLLKASSLCLARRASRPFFFPLASTKPPLSELGRSFGLLPLRHLSAPSENPRRFSVVIPFKSSYRNPFRGFLRVAGSSRLQRPSAAGLFIPSPCWRAEKSTIPHLFVNFFRDVFCDLLRSKSKKISDYQRITFLFFSNKKASFTTKEA